jgi:hypothetical protein
MLFLWLGGHVVDVAGVSQAVALVDTAPRAARVGGRAIEMKYDRNSTILSVSVAKHERIELEVDL